MSDNFSNYDAQALEFLLSTDEFELEETTTNELLDFSIIENANSSKIKPSDERFRDVKFDDIANFLKENENENTRKKTTSDMNLFRTYLVQTGEKTEIENLPRP
jgi:mannose-1-phosphate guanylyltransferase